MKNRSAAEKTTSGMGIIHHPGLHALLIALLALLPYVTTFHYPFYLDDGSNIVENPIIRDLDRFLDGAGFRYNPWRFVGFLTLTLNYHFGGLNVVGYHAVNVAIHVVSALLVWALVRLTFRTPQLRESSLAAQGPIVALVVALLFAVHPVQTQAVTYIVQRFASLSTLFCLLSLVLYGLARIRTLSPVPGPESRITAILLFAGAAATAVLAMMTKEIAFTLPFTVLLYEVSFFRPGPRRRLLLLLPLVAAVVMVPLILLGSEGPLKFLPALDRHLQESTHIARQDYFFTQLRVIVSYLRLLVLPVDQNLDYEYPVYTTLFTPPVFFSALFLMVLLAFAAWLYRRSSLDGGVQGSGTEVQSPGSPVPDDDSQLRDQDQRTTTRQSQVSSHRPPIPELRLAGFGILFFFLTLSVESSVIPIADVIFEHRLYLPSVGIFLLFAVFAVRVSSRFSPRAGGLALAVIILVLGIATFNRNQLWSDPVAMWNDVIRKSPGKERGYVNLGYVLLEKGQLDEAIEKLNVARMLNPEYAKTYLNLGIALGKKGMLDAAVATLEKALQLDPKLWLAHFNLGIIEGMRGHTDKAVEHMEMAVRRNPYDVQARAQLVRLYMLKGEFDKAKEQQRAYSGLVERR